MIQRAMLRLACIIVTLWSCLSVDAEDLSAGFQHPPDQARPWVYWWWLNGNVSRDGITRDLEEMQRQGIGGVLLFHADGGAGVPPGPEFLSPEWKALFQFAVSEAARLNIDMSLNLCDGWCAGGPWITPEGANKQLVYAEAQIDGPSTVAMALPMPKFVDGFHRDVAVVAYRDRPTRPVAPVRVVANSGWGGFGGEWIYPPAAALDGDPNTCWVASPNARPTAAKPVGLELQYAGPLRASSLYVDLSPGASPRNCRLEASDDGLSYRSVARFALESGRPQRVEFSAIAATRFRLCIESTFPPADSAVEVASDSPLAGLPPLRLAEVWLLGPGDEPPIRPGIKWWMFKSANRSFWTWPDDGPALLPQEYRDDGAVDVKSSDVVVLSASMSADGRLTWEAPAGRWTILRFGCTLEGQKTRCSANDRVGYEADMLDSRGIDLHFQSLVDPVLQLVPGEVGKTLQYLHVDSYELGADVAGQQPTWSEHFAEEFVARRGYDLTRWLPALSGRIVDGRQQTDRFLWDVRRTVADLFAERFWARYVQLCHERGLLAESETGYGTYPMPNIDGLQCAGQNDATMGEFWTFGGPEVHQYNAFCNIIRSVASAAHVYGRRIVQAEAFTTWAHFQESPSSLKPVGDEAFCDGLNRVVWHQYTHQPRSDMQPGWQYFAGTHVDRNLTWWEEASAFLEYLARCQYLLQAGRFHADVCYFYGEGAPAYVPSREKLRPALPEGYNFDAVNADVLLHRMRVRNGRLALPDGPSYRVLVLPEEPTLSPAVLRKLTELVKGGAVVLGPRTERAPGLSGYPGCDHEVRQLAGELWGDCDGRTVKEHRLGKGRVVWGEPMDAVLADSGVAPDFEPLGSLPTWPDLSGASWIWHAADGAEAPAAERWFEAEFDLPPSAHITAALVSMTADNEFELSANGHDAGRGGDWQRVFEADVTAYLHAGRNVLSIRARNTLLGPAGLVAKLVVRLESGGSFTLATDAQHWQSSAGDEHWEPVAVLGAMGMQPWGTVGGGGKPSLRFIHRQVDGAELYFVSHRGSHTATLPCAFRVAGRQPELWDPVSGAMRDLPEYSMELGRTVVPLRFEPEQSYFIVFRKPLRRQAGKGVNFAEVKPIAELAGPWEVHFDPRWGGPDHTVFDALESWTQRAEAGVKIYSGRATYAKTFDLPAASRGRLWLDLGEVLDVARVRLNGADLGVVWTAPWRLDITDVLRSRGNRLEIDVINLWPNRMIGDAALPPERRYTRTNLTVYRADAPLRPSGLLGPVRLLSSD